MENAELNELVQQLSRVIDVLRTKSSLVEEENMYYREECAKLMQSLAQINKDQVDKKNL
jgi:hypothetical protein